MAAAESIFAKKIKTAMKRDNLKKICAIVLMLIGVVHSSAQDFSVADKNGNRFYFNIIDSVKNNVELTFCPKGAEPYKGEITVPAKVKYNGVVYDVTAVGRKAFADALELTGVIFPAGVMKVGAFAFDNCARLSKIIFPGNAMDFEEGVFFRCPSICNVTFGSDWKNVDLRLFQWSDSLRTLRIPAKMSKIHNLKSLVHLESVDVDPNNASFASKDGLLYNREMSLLYACPLSYSGTVCVQEGVTEIYRGALSDCVNVTDVTLPASLEKMSYLEFAGSKSLRSVTILSEVPFFNAVQNGKECFTLRIPEGSEVVLYVQKQSKKAFKESLKYDSLEFSEIGEDNVRKLDAKDIVSGKRLKTIK